MLDGFAVFILSYKRPDNVVTYKTLRKCGFTGKIYIIVGLDDETLPAYKKRYGSQVIVFDKSKCRFDIADNLGGQVGVVFPRNASFDIARELGLDYFLQLDDDYSAFVYKFTASLDYKERPVKSLDKLFGIMLDFYKSINADTIALAQNGDFIGGRYSKQAINISLKRKAMNTFFCSTSKPIEFVGRLNEDVSTYVSLGNRGRLFFTVFLASIIQGRTQKGKGGCSDLYADLGTYSKSFYTVMFSPSCVSIGMMGDKHRRIHHKIDWGCAVPRIVCEDLRKTPGE